MKNLITLSLLALVFFTSCKKERLSANGNITEETRAVGAFTGIHTSGSAPIHVLFGNEYKVVVKGSSNLLPYYETDVTNGKLYLNYERVSVRNSDIEVFVTLPNIKNISLSGSAKIDISGAFPLITRLDADVSGSGSISLKDQVYATAAVLNISGSGNVDFKRLNCTSAKATISGSGDISLSVADFLKANISGSGNIYYSGNPEIETSISGSGRVIKR